MSSPILLFLFLLYISVHACNARLHDIFHKGFGKYMEKADFDVAKNPVKQMQLSPDEIQARRWKPVDGEVAMDHRHGGASTEKEKESEDLARIMNVRRGMIPVSGAIRIKSLLTVSWRIPHEKDGEHHPGFNLDYSGPQTHPPSHN
ncbi:root meristem growth factor 10 [Magnolia sinica]|uniref:root meristem growth factor 10 n=1 Tax=Magnolia sinica TaxID=86752 RepID=UPI00265955E1|nr:root meristem growth factor 10 [Magnolia sinica]